MNDTLRLHRLPGVISQGGQRQPEATEKMTGMAGPLGYCRSSTVDSGVQGYYVCDVTPHKPCCALRALQLLELLITTSQSYHQKHSHFLSYTITQHASTTVGQNVLVLNYN